MFLMITIRIYPRGCCGRFLFFIFFPLLFNGGLLLRSHPLRQFARLSKSEKSGLSVLTPRRGCAPYPNQQLFSFLSRVHTFRSRLAQLRCLSLSPPHLLSCQHFHLDWRKTRLWVWEQKFNELKKCSIGFYCHVRWASLSSSSTLKRCFIWSGSGTLPASKVTLLFSLQQIIHPTPSPPKIKGKKKTVSIKPTNFQTVFLSFFFFFILNVWIEFTGLE